MFRAVRTFVSQGGPDPPGRGRAGRPPTRTSPCPTGNHPTPVSVQQPCQPACTSPASGYCRTKSSPAQSSSSCSWPLLRQQLIPPASSAGLRIPRLLALPPSLPPWQSLHRGPSPYPTTTRLAPAPTAVTAVHDGYVLQKSAVRSPIGGATLSRALLNAVQAAGTQVHPRFDFVRVETSPGQFEVCGPQARLGSCRDFASVGWQSAVGGGLMERGAGLAWTPGVDEAGRGFPAAQLCCRQRRRADVSRRARGARTLPRAPDLRRSSTSRGKCGAPTASCTRWR